MIDMYCICLSTMCGDFLTFTTAADVAVDVAMLQPQLGYLNIRTHFAVVAHSINKYKCYCLRGHLFCSTHTHSLDQTATRAHISVFVHTLSLALYLSPVATHTHTHMAYGGHVCVCYTSKSHEHVVTSSSSLLSR